MLFDQTIFYLIFTVIINFFLSKRLSWIKTKIIIFDNPDNSRKIHSHPTPLFGGLLIYINLFIFFLFFFLFDKKILVENLRLSENIVLIFFFVIFSIIFLVGLYDDKFSISSRLRTLILFLLVWIFIYASDIVHLKEIKFFFVEANLELERFKVIFPSICILILMISCNLYDGINFQSFLFYFINFSFLFFLKDNFFILIIIISLLFFGYMNFKGRIFLGDSGVYLLSFILGYFYIVYYNLQFKTIYAEQIFLILLFPILDATRVFIVRLISNKNIFEPDQNHFHHLILKKFGKRESLVILTLFNFFPVMSYFISLKILISFSIYIFCYFAILFFSRNIKI